MTCHRSSLQPLHVVAGVGQRPAEGTKCQIPAHYVLSQVSTQSMPIRENLLAQGLSVSAMPMPDQRGGKICNTATAQNDTEENIQVFTSAGPRARAEQDIEPANMTDVVSANGEICACPEDSGTERIETRRVPMSSQYKAEDRTPRPIGSARQSTALILCLDSLKRLVQ